MRAAVLVHHHPHQRSRLAAFAVGATFFAFGHQLAFLQVFLDPAVAARTAFAFVPAVEMFDVPSQVLAPVFLGQPHHLVHRSQAIGSLLQPTVNQTLQSQGLVASQVTPKTTLANPQYQRRLGLRKPARRPPYIGFLESHLANLL